MIQQVFCPYLDCPCVIQQCLSCIDPPILIQLVMMMIAPELKNEHDDHGSPVPNECNRCRRSSHCTHTFINVNHNLTLSTFGIYEKVFVVLIVSWAVIVVTSTLIKICSALYNAFTVIWDFINPILERCLSSLKYIAHLIVGDRTKLYTEGTTPMFDQAREQSDRDNPRRSPRIAEKTFEKPNLHIDIPEHTELGRRDFCAESDAMRYTNKRRGG